MKYKTSCSLLIIGYLVVLAATSLPLASEIQAQSVSKLHDAWLKGRLDTLLVLDPNLRAYNLVTEVDGGRAVLHGAVATQFEKEFAEDLAKNVDGTERVDNRINLSDAVQSPISLTSLEARDRAVTAAIHTKFLLNPVIKSSAIEIDTEESYVQLKGTVTSAAERELAEKIARDS